MFYSEAILARRGPLAKVWIAAHMERKLSKTQTLQTNIEESVGAIMGQEVEIMALRLSGQLLLGVVRIYSRKARYLLDDCNEALLKIKMAFRPGIVDMTEDQLAVNRNAITLQDNNIDLDLLLPDMNWDMDFEERAANPQNQHVARITDITLATGEDLHLNLGEPEFDFDLGLGDGIGSQDYELDLGIDFGDGPTANDAEKPKEAENGEADETMSVEVGRDAMSHRSARESIGSHLIGRDNFDLDILSHRSKSREASEHPMDVDFGADFGGMDIDLGLDFGDMGDTTLGTALGAGEGENPEQQQPPRSPSRASSRLTTPPPTPPPEDPNVTPRATAPEGEAEKRTRRIIQKKQIIDSVTELADGPGLNIRRGRNGDLGSQTKDVSEILQKQQFLPRSRCVMRLLEIRKDPLAHFLPTKVTTTGTYFCAGPPGLAPELEEMFMRPITNILSTKRRGISPEKGGSKRARIEDENAGAEDVEVEQARRAGSIAQSDALRRDSLAPPDISGNFDFGDETGMNTLDDYQFDLGGEADVGLEGAAERARSKSRMSTPALDGEPIDETAENFADATCAIAFFDERQQSQSQTQGENVSAPPEPDARGYSKNTVKALTFIRRELQPATTSASSSTPQEKVISFNQVSVKATRRAASSFFFELLVLGTRDCVKLSQPKPYENIEVRAKDKLWERQRHATAHGTTSKAGVSQSQPYTTYSRATSVAVSLA